MGLFDIFKKKVTEAATRQPRYEVTPNLPELQFISLFFETKPIIDKEAILQELKLNFKEVNIGNGDSPLIFFFPEHEVKMEDASIPAQGVVIENEKKPDLERFTSTFQQSWHWDNSKSILEKCNFELNLTDLLSRTLPPQIRIDYFQKFVRAVVRITNPKAIYFRNSDKLVEPTDFLAACDSEHSLFLYGAMNIRLFNIVDEGKQEILMDTIGLHAFGLTDFECRFSEYDPGEIAGILQNVAYYVFATGDTIRSNSTVQGIGKNPVWQTKYADAKVKPSRLVVEIIPN